MGWKMLGILICGPAIAYGIANFSKDAKLAQELQSNKDLLSVACAVPNTPAQFVPICKKYGNAAN